MRIFSGNSFRKCCNDITKITGKTFILITKVIVKFSTGAIHHNLGMLFKYLATASLTLPDESFGPTKSLFSGDNKDNSDISEN